MWPYELLPDTGRDTRIMAQDTEKYVWDGAGGRWAIRRDPEADAWYVVDAAHAPLMITPGAGVTCQNCGKGITGDALSFTSRWTSGSGPFCIPCATKPRMLQSWAQREYEKRKKRRWF